jgi:acyl-CoA synthetase (AMP-forming)/AMP-acid ligase II
LHDTIRTVLTSNPDVPAIEFEGRWHPMREFAALLARLDELLCAYGLGAHTRIGLIARNRPAHVGAFGALLATQRCVIMIYSAQSAEAIANDVRKLRLPAVIADTEDWTAGVAAAARATGTFGFALTHDERAVLAVPTAGVLAAGALDPGTPGMHVQSAADPGVAMELLSSGTTGAPKRVPLRVSTFEQAISDSAATYASGGNDIQHAPSIVFHPLGNVAGVTFVIPFLIGAHPIALLERFNLTLWLDAVRRHRPSRASLPPAILRTLLDENISKEDLASFGAIGVGAVALDPELQERFEERYGIPLLAGYGATEFCGVVANWTLDLYRQFGRAKRGSVGRPRPDVRLRVIDPEAGCEQPVGQVGVLEVRALRVGDDWIRTTDLASIDEDGFLYLHGRADSAINRGGFKVLPEEVAHVLRQHAKVADAAVIGVADTRLGQVPVAAVEARVAARPPTEQELEAFARSRLLSYAVPVRFLIVDALPRNASMKVNLPELHRLVRALLEAPADVQSIPE